MGRYYVNRRLLILVSLLLYMSVGSVQAYTTEEYYISIDPPSGWKVDDTTTDAVVFFYGPTEEGFTVNINVKVENTSLILEEYVSSAKQQFPVILPHYELVSEGSRVINEIDAYELVSTFIYEGVKFQIKQVMLVEKEKAYIITFGGLPSAYHKYLLAFETSVGTFKIIGPTPWYIKYWYLWVIIGVTVAALTFYFFGRSVKALPRPKSIQSAVSKKVNISRRFKIIGRWRSRELE